MAFFGVTLFQNTSESYRDAQLISGFHTHIAAIIKFCVKKKNRYLREALQQEHVVYLKRLRHNS